MNNNFCPLELNSQYGGNYFTKNWWIIVLGIFAVIVISFIIFKVTGSDSTSESTTTSSNVSYQKKMVDGEEQYFKVVDGNEEEITEEDKQILNNTELQVKAIQDKEIENIKNLTTNINTDMSNYLDNLQTNN